MAGGGEGAAGAAAEGRAPGTACGPWPGPPARTGACPSPPAYPPPHPLGSTHLNRVRSAMAPLTTVALVAEKAQPKNQAAQ